MALFFAGLGFHTNSTLEWTQNKAPQEGARLPGAQDTLATSQC